MSVQASILLNGEITQSAAADNATATASVAAIGSQTHGILGIYADYSAAPAAGFKTITLLKDAVTIAVFRHDFSTGPFNLPFHGAVWGEAGGAVSATLGASGTAGVTGRVSLFHFPK